MTVRRIRGLLWLASGIAGALAAGMIAWVAIPPKVSPDTPAHQTSAAPAADDAGSSAATAPQPRHDSSLVVSILRSIPGAVPRPNDRRHHRRRRFNDPRVDDAPLG